MRLHSNNDNAEGLSRSLAASRRLLMAAQCDLQVCKSVALNRLESLHAAMSVAVTAQGLSATQCAELLDQLERSMLVLETDGRERLEGPG